MKTLLSGLMVLAFSLPACGGGTTPPEQPERPAAPEPAPEPVAADEPPPPPPPADTEGPNEDEDPNAMWEGVEGGVQGGVLGGGPGPTLPPPPPMTGPIIVPNSVLEARRIAGDKRLVPRDEDKLAMQKAGKTQVVTTVKMCVNDAGKVDSTKLLKSSGYPAYDAMIRAAIEKTWTYRPFTINGKPVAVCTSVMFIYKQTP
jgi:hypothetical protein